MPPSFAILSIATAEDAAGWIGEKKPVGREYVVPSECSEN